MISENYFTLGIWSIHSSESDSEFENHGGLVVKFPEFTPELQPATEKNHINNSNVFENNN